MVMLDTLSGLVECSSTILVKQLRDYFLLRSKQLGHLTAVFCFFKTFTLRRKNHKASISVAVAVFGWDEVGPLDPNF